MASSKGIRNFLKRHLLLLMILLAMIIGISLGIGLRSLDPPMSKREQMYLKYPGELLMRMLKLLILPLIMSSLIAGLATLDSKATGKLGGRAILYYMSTTLIAVILGIILVVGIRPGGDGTKDTIRDGTAKLAHPADAFLDLIRNLFPPNIMESCFRHTTTTYPDVPVKNTGQVDTNNTTNETKTSTMPMTTMNMTKSTNPATKKPAKNYDNFSVGMKDGMNVLGIVLFSIVFGIIISRLEKKMADTLINVFVALNEAIMRMVALVIWYSPIGILFLVAERVVSMENIEEVVEKLGMYAITVLAGLAIHGMIILPLIYLIFVRKNPFVFIGGVLQALITALGTSSSSATLPVTISCLEGNNGIDKRITRFVLPVGATINMDGTALYEAVAAIFIAQMNGIDLDFGQIIAVSITATAASIGAAGVPQAGLVTMVIVLSAVGLPLEDVTLIIAIDWFLDRFRTMVNVLGDSIGAGVVAHFSQDDLDEMDGDDVIDDISVQLEAPAIYKKVNSISNGNTNGAYSPADDDTKM